MTYNNQFLNTRILFSWQSIATKKQHMKWFAELEITEKIAQQKEVRTKTIEAAQL